MSSTTASTMQTTFWLGMRFKTPADWEILRHNIEPDKGQLVFADRTQGRLHVAWAAADRCPDVDQLFTDRRNRDKQHSDTCRFQSIPTIGQWQGYRCQQQTQTVTRAGIHDPIHRRWVELAIIWPDKLDQPLEQDLLSAFEVLDDRGGATRWRAFGIDAQAPPGWRLAQAEVKPAAATMHFAQGNHCRAIVRRYGLTDAWYHGDPQKVIQRDVKRPDRCIFEPAIYRGRGACVAHSDETPGLWQRLTHRGRYRTDWVWPVKPDGDRLYHVTTIGPRREMIEPSSFLADPSQEGCHP